MSVRKVDNRTAALISAGQVITSVGSAVKELIENSLDAKASIIRIDLNNYGLDSIEVDDNGSGIVESDFPVIAQKHCTSKIGEFDDLKRLNSFGFRGEALHSLCSFSQMTVITKHSNDEIGTKLVFTNQGTIDYKCPVAREVGTTVILKDLFVNFPVRRKQLMTEFKKEFQKMIQLITPYFLGYSKLNIRCRNTQKNKMSDVLCVSANNNIRDNIIQMFGIKQVEAIQEFVQHPLSEDICTEFGIDEKMAEKQNGIVITGFVSKCESNCGRSSSDRQFYFMNERPFDFKQLKKSINDVYGYYCKNQYPFVLLKIDVPKHTIDVNVSPNKRQLLIEDEVLIVAIVKASLRQAYHNRSLNYSSQNELRSMFQKKINDLKDKDEAEERTMTSIKLPPAVTKRCASPCDLIFQSQSPAAALDVNAPNFGDLSLSPPANGSENSDESFLVEEQHSHPPCQKRLQHTTEETVVPKRIRVDNDTGKRQTSITEMFHPLRKESESVKDNQDNSPLSSDFVTFNVGRESGLIATRPLVKNSSVTPNMREASEEPSSFVEIIRDSSEEIVRRQVNVNLSIESIEETFLKECSLEDEWIENDRFSAKISPLDNTKAENELKSELCKESFKEMEIIGQFNKGFIIVKHNRDVFIIDQHATDERFNFEELCEKTVLDSQPLVHHLPLEFGAFHESILSNNIPYFTKCGFSFIFDNTSPPGKRAKLVSVPISKDWIFGKQDIEEMLHEIIESGGLNEDYRPSRVTQMLASRACRKSIMIGDKLTISQMKVLVEHMSSTKFPWVCAHGRPTIRHLFNLDSVLFC